MGAYADSDDEENDISEKPAQSKEANETSQPILTVHWPTS